jgi:signal peptidase I
MNAKLKKALGINRPRLALAIICCGITMHFAFPRYVVATESMVPTIPPGSYVVTVRSSLLPGSIGKNDIVVFKPVEGVSPAPWIHRIVALSGEKITPPDRKGRVDISTKARSERSHESQESLVVPVSFFYQSGDSQASYHGLVPQEIVVGKALFHFKLPWR